MARKTIYCAQGFWWQDGRLVGGETHQFLTADRAQDGAEIIAQGADGAAAYSLTGEPDVDFWDEPRILVTFGTCPKAGRDPWLDDAA